mmetsp:Transcript_41612/g.133813  ORF Transcript_41612/g.133813 Transcript_41612/m.133813 type:complete len:268 (+) Transcript_41612:163-966(+)
MTMSSIFRMSRTHSVASETAEVWTRSGTSTFSSRMFVTLPLRTLMPAAFSPSACLFRSSVTTWMASSPAFSASVYGTTSIASANARTQYECMPSSESAHLESSYESRISGAPPPGVRNRFLTRQRSTQSASCSERSDSSSTRLLDALHRMVTVLPSFGTPVTRTILPSLVDTSWTSSARPSFSGWKVSMFAMGRQPQVLQMNSTSSRSMSLTTRIFIFARKCSDRSLTASRRIDFWMSSTLQPLFCTFLHMSRMYLRSSLRIRSICV